METLTALSHFKCQAVQPEDNKKLSLGLQHRNNIGKITISIYIVCEVFNP
jgi:hypothetical protein